jgi:hypothetical protein
MSLIRAALILGAAVMLLPVDEKKQAAFSATATKAAAETATFCERNVHTCGAGRELWSLFLYKAEYGMELGARLVRDQFLRGDSSEMSSISDGSENLAPRSNIAAQYRQDSLPNPASNQAGYHTGEVQPRRSAYPMDHPPRWR